MSEPDEYLTFKANIDSEYWNADIKAECWTHILENGELQINLQTLDPHLGCLTITCSQKSRLPPKALKAIVGAMKNTLPQVLAIAWEAAFIESCEKLLGVEKLATRDVILQMYEKDFNRRHAVTVNGDVLWTFDSLIEHLIIAWQRLEKEQKKEITNPSINKLAHILEISPSRLSKLLSRFSKSLSDQGEAKNYKHIFNIVRQKKKLLATNPKFINPASKLS